MHATIINAPADSDSGCADIDKAVLLISVDDLLQKIVADTLIHAELRPVSRE